MMILGSLRTMRHVSLRAFTRALNSTDCLVIFFTEKARRIRCVHAAIVSPELQTK
jgi:hypothetical protein